MPIANPADASDFQVPDNAKKYIGRYQVEVSFRDFLLNVIQVCQNLS